MTRYDFDLAVLGGGSAGYAAARAASGYGLRTAIVDGSETLGGLCILRGCMPSKTVIESANRALTLRRAREFGLRAGEVAVHPREIRDRKRKLIAEFADYRRGQLLEGPFELIRGTTRFLDAHRIAVSPNGGGPSRELTAAAAIIASGSVISQSGIPGLLEAGYLTSDHVLDGDRIPESLVVLGGGPIALELAHYFEALDAKVTVVQRSPQVLKSVDADSAQALAHALQARGIEIICDTRLEKVSREGGRKTVHFTHRGQERRITSQEILLALGRTPATAGLELAAAGVDVRGATVMAGPTQATSVPHIFAAGDVCGPYEIVHLAIEQGETAAANAAVHLGALPPERARRMDYRLKLFGVFTQPQLAVAGLTEREAAAAGLDFRAASHPFADHGKSMVMGETDGFVKLLADKRTGELIGAAAVGPEAVELIHEIVVAMRFHCTAAQLASIPHYHPTLSEIWTYPAEELAASLSS